MSTERMVISLSALAITLAGALWYVSEYTIKEAKLRQTENCITILRNKTHNNITYPKAKEICIKYLEEKIEKENK